MNGLTVLIVAAGAVLFFGGIAIAARVMDRDDRRDPFGPEDDPGQAPGFGDMPPEIAHEPPRQSIHELPPLGDAVWHQYPMTSPAAMAAPPAAPFAGASAGPGTAAAAEAPPGAAPPAPAPPPLPDPAYACANPLAYPLAWLESDTFVGGLTAIKDGAP